MRIVTSSFEEWEPGAERFDAVVAFNSFHWVDPERRYAKPAELLPAGGTLAVVGMRLVVHGEADPVWRAAKEDQDALAGGGAWIHVDEIQDRSAEFEASGLFRLAARRRYLWDLTFDADGFVALLETASWQRALEEDVRRELFERIRRRIESRPEATIMPTMAAVLYVARRL